MSDKELQKEAYHEALRRYPDSHAALVFLWSALGLGAIQPSEEVRDLVKATSSQWQGQ